MGGVNLGRVLSGGIFAGAVILIGEVVIHAFFLGEAWLAALEALGIEFTTASAFTWGAGAFLAGIVGLWIYAAIRVRYGPGPKTALRAATAMWMVAYLVPCVGMMGMPGFPIWLLGFAVAWGYVEVAVAVTAGSWMYIEDGPPVG